MKNSENDRRIRKTSRKLRLLFQVSTFLLPLIPVVCWLLYNDLPQVMHQNIFPGKTVDSLPLNGRLIALGGSLPATVIMVLALIKLKRLFFLYEQGIFFQAENVLLFRLLARLAFWSVLADVFNKTVLEIALTINNPPGQRVLAIGFSSDHLKLLIVAVIIMLIGMVIEEGRKIHEEMQLTV
ncbi:MAG TPA: hypothetical protein DDY32_15710 [Desulfobulbaceae bacterium]|nr:hypothetical protein [Desulfobulbaceae bacterium]